MERIGQMDETSYWAILFESVGPLSSSKPTKSCTGVDHTCPEWKDVELTVTHVSVPCDCEKPCGEHHRAPVDGSEVPEG